MKEKTHFAGDDPMARIAALEAENAWLKEHASKIAASTPKMAEEIISLKRSLEKARNAIEYGMSATCIAADTNPESAIGKLYDVLCDGIGDLPAFPCAAKSIENNNQSEMRIAALESLAGVHQATIESLKGERDTLRQQLATTKANEQATHDANKRMAAELFSREQQLATAQEALETVVERFMPCRDEYIFSKRVALDKAAKALAAIGDAFQKGE